MEGKTIFECYKGCEECQKDSARYNELVAKLSELHIHHETDPEKLCSATFHEFSRTHLDYNLHPVMQSELFNLANQHDLPWSRV